MTRSTRSQKAHRLNVACGLLADSLKAPAAVERMSNQFGNSRGQAYRYVRAVRTMSEPADVSELSVPITLKIPRSLVAALRAFSRSSGLSMGEIVARAPARFLRDSGRRGRTGAGRRPVVSLHGVTDRLGAVKLQQALAILLPDQPRRVGELRKGNQDEGCRHQRPGSGDQQKSKNTIASQTEALITLAREQDFPWHSCSAFWLLSRPGIVV